MMPENTAASVPQGITRARAAGIFALAMAEFAGLALLCIFLSRATHNVAYLWLANTATFVWVVRCAASDRAFVLGGAFFGNLLANLLYGDTLPFSVGVSGANLIDVCIASALTLRYVPVMEQPFTLNSAVRVLGLNILVANTVAAIVGSTVVWGTLGVPWQDVFVNWWTGGALGVALLALPGLAVHRSVVQQLVTRRGMTRLGAELLVSLLLVGLMLRFLSFPFIYVIIPLTIVALRSGAFRAGLIGNLLLVLLGVLILLGQFQLLDRTIAQGPRALFSAAALSCLFPVLMGIATQQAREQGLRLARTEASSQAKLQAVIDAAIGFAIIATDPRGVVRIFSSGAEQLLGFRSEELVGRSLTVMLHVPEEIEARSAELSAQVGRPLLGFEVLVERARHGERETREWTYRCKDGTPIPVQVVVTATRDAEGTIDGFLSIAQDITEQRHIQAALAEGRESAEQASRLKSEFLANMSHEIRTPMNAVLGMAHLLGDSPLSAEQRRFLDMIRVSSQSLLTILNDILDFSKVEVGRLELSPQVFQLSDVMDALATVMSISAGEKELELLMEVEPSVPRAFVGDALRLQQILVNLVGNAIKFTPSGEVQVRVSVESVTGTDVRLRFQVQDTGIGILPEQMSRLFTPFSQADGSMTRRFGGTGLGLAISRRLVEMMGGEIGVESEAGKGSQFWCIIPLQARPETSVPVRETLPPLLRIQLMVGNASVDAWLTRQLGAQGWQVQSARSLTVAAQQLQSARAAGTPCDVLLIDQKSLETEVWNDLTQLRPRLQPALSPETVAVAGVVEDAQVPPIVMMVPLKHHARSTDALGKGLISGVLVKPVTGAQLLDSLGRVVHPGVREVLTPQTTVGPRRLAGMSLLLVEDHPLNQILARTLLERAGAAVEVVSDGRQAVERLRSHSFRYHVVLMDVQMPVLDGLAATRIIRQELKLDLPIIAMTAGVMQSEREQCAQAGMTDLIPKPMNVAQALEVLAAYHPTHRLKDVQALTVISQTESAAIDPPYFDAEALLEQLEGSQSLQRTLLLQFMRISRENLRDVRKGLAVGSRREAAGPLHSLKGAAGGLTAKPLSLEAALAEDIALHGDLAELEPALLRMERILAETMASIQQWLEVTPVVPDVAESGLEDRFAEMRELMKLLIQRNLAACAYFSALRNRLSAYLDAEQLERLDRAMDDLNFDEAVQILTPLLPESSTG